MLRTHEHRGPPPQILSQPQAPYVHPQKTSKIWSKNGHSPQIRQNVSRRVTFFSKKPFGECRRMYRVRPKQVGECRRMSRVRPKQVGECRRMYRVRPKQVGKCRRVWRLLAKHRQMLAHDKIGCFKHK